ncbi:MAG: hypothetical protein R3323_10830, partial [Wenzhouxiangellaceae bacterium]|nr:hypothetical protein [Wenzhouxiangellaceae bacterium]
MNLFRSIVPACALGIGLALSAGPLLADVERGGVVVHPDAKSAATVAAAPAPASAGRILVNESAPAAPSADTASAQPRGQVMVNDAAPPASSAGTIQGVNTAF